MYQQQSTVQRNTSLLANHKVLRSTYFLLSLTLLFSAATAGWALVNHATPVNPILNLIVSFALLFATMKLRNSSWGIVTLFGFTGFFGYALGPVLNFYITQFSNGSALVLSALATTGVTFFVMSALAIAKPQAVTRLGGILMAGLIVVVIASLLNLFLHLPALQLAISIIAALVFAGFIAWDTQRIISGGETNYIMATMSLYLNIVNLFMSLLQIFAAFSGRD
ncbi:Bax inhibitor-1 family protein [Piscirickettsia salmonis]|uniref:Bax inhibitor-1 family protein n=1 Tax=Piscirickettsia salmonis TaxID=1238 RepID=UPI0007C95D8E|nr:Modulator of FtsH protease YccA [Piscirickettsiaceae bacterium NZ-RLO1]